RQQARRFGASAGDRTDKALSGRAFDLRRGGMRNRFAAWAAGTQTSVESRVTRVTRVTPDQNPRISAELTPSQAVTQAQEPRVTRVTAAEVVTHVTQAPGLGLRGKNQEIQSCNRCNPRNPQNSYESHVSDDELEERAAIVQEGSGAPREWAEAFA